jgi:GAF domain-containing protein
VETVLRALARVSLHDRPLGDVLQEITDIARDGVPGAEATSVTLVRGDRAYTAAHSGEMALAADELQYERGWGPCMDAGRTGLTMVVDDMAAEERWPDYTVAVVDTGVRSSMSVPLPYQGATIGALNVYSSTPGSFGADAVSAGEEVADWLAVAVRNAEAHDEAVRLAADMRRAMESRAVIDMAKGIIIARQHCSPEEAFTILSRGSQNYNRKLRDLAEALVASESGQAQQPETRPPVP